MCVLMWGPEVNIGAVLRTAVNLLSLPQGLSLGLQKARFAGLYPHPQYCINPSVVYMPIISAIGRLRQEDQKWRVILATQGIEGQPGLHGTISKTKKVREGGGKEGREERKRKGRMDRRTDRQMDRQTLC